MGTATPKKEGRRADPVEKSKHSGFLLTEMLGFEDMGRRALLGAAMFVWSDSSLLPNPGRNR